MNKALKEEGVPLQPLAGVHYGHYEIPTCAICRCTQTAPCFDGEQVCFWVTLSKETNEGLCSECMGF